MNDKELNDLKVLLENLVQIPPYILSDEQQALISKFFSIVRPDSVFPRSSNALVSIMGKKIYVDIYHPVICRVETFHVLSVDDYPKSITFTANDSYSIVVFFDKDFQKMGQTPSHSHFKVIDVDIKKINKYLGDDSKYLYKADLSSDNNLYIGAFVYLRRIFENIIDSKLKELSNKGKSTSDNRMKEKVSFLVNEHQLDSTFKEQGFAKMYSLLSDAVHNLSEAECKENFLILREAIMMIIKDQIAHEQQQQRKKNLQATLNSL
ncbi:hypothetical protein [Culicoidibacter larvae]|uniref:Uncharacterized protein n=1 Tax=Culicoidibacter larvae TaxID=2579976 RepID=A0A5R8QJC4_9FIRM|nr:hypothetical protein [Culicoidibacter larvae]TLG77357.1 hypothetical protein FEZ08_01690 [Culicoidibacter larvae]